jgi:hypothetical protein
VEAEETVVARQRLRKYIQTVTNTDTEIEELLGVMFFIRSVQVSEKLLKFPFSVHKKIPRPYS